MSDWFPPPSITCGFAGDMSGMRRSNPEGSGGTQPQRLTVRSGRMRRMKYVLLICDDEKVSPTNEELDADPVHQAWAADLERRGAKLSGARLRPVVDATSVRVRDGETLVSDGPYAETKDFVGGFVVVECSDLDEAIAIAAGHPYAQWGGVEIRPVWE
jgi:hypothetical protein